MPILRTFWVPITISMGQPQAEPGPSGPLTQWVKVDVPMPDTDAIAAAHKVKLPAFVNQRRACIATVNGQARKLSAAVAILLDRHRRGEALRARPDTLRKLAAELPEFAGRVVRRGKCRAGMTPVSVEGDWVA